VRLAQSLKKSPNYPVERTAGSHRVAAAAHRSVEFVHNDDKDNPTRWPAGKLRKVNPSSIMRLSVIPEGDRLTAHDRLVEQARRSAAERRRLRRRCPFDRRGAPEGGPEAEEMDMNFNDQAQVDECMVKRQAASTDGPGSNRR
jgi:hypothetical protein